MLGRCTADVQFTKTLVWHDPDRRYYRGIVRFRSNCWQDGGLTMQTELIRASADTRSNYDVDRRIRRSILLHDATLCMLCCKPKPMQ